MQLHKFQNKKGNKNFNKYVQPHQQNNENRNILHLPTKIANLKKFMLTRRLGRGEAK